MEILKEYALRFVGIPYRWSGDDALAGYDCSGLCQELLAMMGVDPPGDQSADGLYRHFLKHGTLDVYDLGSLAFYGTPEKITHVTLLLDAKHMIEAGGGGSKTLTLQDAINQNAYVRVRPLRTQGLVAVILPKY